MGILYVCIMKINIIVITFVLLSFLTGCGERTVETQKFEEYKVNVKSSLRVRMAPDKNAEKLGDLFNGEKVAVVDISDGWAKINFNGTTGYVSDKYLSKVEATSTADLDPSSQIESINQAENSRSENSRSDNTEYVFASTSQSVSGSSSVTVFDRAKILSPAQIDSLVSTRLKGDEKILVVTVDSVGALSAASYADDMLSMYQDDVMGENSDKLYVVSYIHNLKLLQLRSSHSAGDFIGQSDPTAMFNYQLMARDSVKFFPVINDYIAYLDDKCVEYESLPWYRTFKYEVGGLEDYICDGLVLNFILPSDSVVYRYFFRWLMCVPKFIAFTAFSLTGSITGTALLFMLLVCGLWLSFQYSRTRRLRSQAWQFRRDNILKLLSFLFMSSIIVLIVLVSPDMNTVTVLEHSGYSPSMISSLIELYSAPIGASTWVQCVILALGIFIVTGLDVDKVVFATLDSRMQKKVFAKQENEIAEEIYDVNKIGMKSAFKEAQRSSHPYINLTAGLAGVAISNAVWAIPAILVFNSSIITVITIYVWAAALNCIVSTLYLIYLYYKMGIYDRYSVGYQKFYSSL